MNIIKIIINKNHEVNLVIFIIKNKKAGLNMKNKRVLKKINHKENLVFDRMLMILVICLITLILLCDV